ncbi:MAG TPA: protein kinase [Thermoanaerobaculia bacterium]|nr:protein kinase [Thermoanaerobaculia bacterium]
MTLSAGTRLGPFEILAPLGAGGMGEVYRARDSRLGREVAVKVLSQEFASDADRRKRFEQEARSASALNHPSIVTIHEIGSADSTFFIAMELVEGRTLREVLGDGPLPIRRLLDLAVQMAEGLAKAHGAGIVHRDLKPENVMVTRDGNAKILDFGLAKLLKPQPEGTTNVPTAVSETQAGTILGTVGYMSPEQASGKPIDYRSDQFALGSILYEMASGKRAFQRDTHAETLTAIIREEPEPVARLAPGTPAPFRWLVERCLHKDPDGRYASTWDLAQDLKSVRDHLSEAGVAPQAAVAPAAPKRNLRRGVLTGLALLAILAAGILVGRQTVKPSPRTFPTFHKLTFRRGEVFAARFAPDGQTIAYGAAWDGRPAEVFFARPESPESRPLGIPGSSVLAISSTGEMALSLRFHFVGGFTTSGMLARMAVAGGGAPRDILDDVQWADWSPDGTNLAVVREIRGRNQLEFPIDKPLYQTAGWISHPRVSPDGNLIAFLEHPILNDDGGSLAVTDRSGKKRTLADGFSTVWGLAWASGGKEIWFTASRAGSDRSLYAVALSGKERLLNRITGGLTLHDVSRDGRALLSHDFPRLGILGLSPGETKERELSWLDNSLAADLSADGQTLLIAESGEGGGPGYSVFVRKMDGSPAVRLGEGDGSGLSPDGKWALAINARSEPAQIVMLPTGAGEPRQITHDNLNHQRAIFFPDGKRVLFSGNEPGRGTRLYVQDLVGGQPQAITPEGIRLWRSRPISPDGKSVIARGPEGKVYLYSVSPEEPRPVPGLEAGEIPVQWSPDGRFLYVYRRGDVPARVFRVDLASGKRELWKELQPGDTTGLEEVANVWLTPDGKGYVYNHIRTLSDLYLAEGLK